METEEKPVWDDLRVLLALHRTRSFLAAGKALGVSTSTAARRIQALEQAVGRSLVHRSSAGTSVEPDALDLVALAEQLELGLQTLRRDEGPEAIAGTVRVSMGDGYVRPITQVLCNVRRMQPSLQLEVISEARYVDLARREADIGIRSARSSSSALVERAVGRLRFGLYASQSYVDRRLRSAQLEVSDLSRHDYVGFEGALARTPQVQWLARRGAARFVFRSNSDAALLEATLQGQGICMLPEAGMRAVTGLVRLTIDAELPSSPVFIAFHRELRRVPRVRLVIDALDGALREGLR